MITGEGINSGVVDDYVPGQGFDYTAEDRKNLANGSSDNPIANSGNNDVDLDDEVNTTFLPGTSAEDIEKGSYRPIPPGHHVVEVKSIEWLNDGNTKSTKAWVKFPNGEVKSQYMDAKSIRITFNLLGDENCTTRDQFIMAPPDSEGLNAYEYGFRDEAEAEKSERSKGGFQAKKLKHFLARLGFQNDANGNLPREASKFRNWMFYEGTTVRKQIKIEVDKPKQGKDYLDKNTGKMVTPKMYSNIKFFSYSKVDPPVAVELARTMARAKANQANMANQASVSAQTQTQPQPSKISV